MSFDHDFDHDFDVVIVGAGQAGLAAGRELSKRGTRIVLLEAEETIGAQWRNRWDSLELFTPAAHDALPDLRFPAPRDSFPVKDQVAQYLADYASRFSLPVRLGVTVGALTRTAGGFAVETTAGRFTSRCVVLASGPNTQPRLPSFAGALGPDVHQMHSSGYRNPAMVAPGDVVVVGAGTSGAQIAQELAATHRTYLAGRPTVHIPDPVLRYAGGLYWTLVNSLLTRRTPMGRKVAAGFHSRGAPLIRVSMRDVEACGVIRLPRATAAREGALVFEGGQEVHPATVIWATGYRPDLGWAPFLQLGPGGVPLTERGVVTGFPGLYTVGMPFQYALTSGLIGGVGRDAVYVAEQVVARLAQAPASD